MYFYADAAINPLDGATSGPYAPTTLPYGASLGPYALAIPFYGAALGPYAPAISLSERADLGQYRAMKNVDTCRSSVCLWWCQIRADTWENVCWLMQWHKFEGWVVHWPNTIKLVLVNWTSMVGVQGRDLR